MKPETAQVLQGLFSLVQNLAMIAAMYKGWDRAVSYFEAKLEHPESYDKPQGQETTVERT